MNIAFEQVDACPVCATQGYRREFTRLFFGRAFCWVRCLDCGAVYQQPKLTRSSLARIYNSSAYWVLDNGRRNRLGYGDYLATAPKRVAQAAQRAAQLAPLLPPRARLLDVGCAAGFFVRAACDQGLEAEGVELCQTMADYGRRHLGLTIHTADLETAGFEPESFQAVTAWGLDSNFHDPRTAFTRMSRLVEPGGLLAFNFFDYDHWSRPLLGEFKKAYNALYFLGSRHVRLLLMENCMELVSLSGEWHYTSLEEILHLTGHQWLRCLAVRLRLAQRLLRLPVPGSYLAVARKRGRGSGSL